MSTTTKCKLYCTSKTKSYPGQGSYIELTALYPGETGVKEADYENAVFGRSTPNATMKMTISNPEAEAMFEPGVFYYLDFTKVPADRQKV